MNSELNTCTGYLKHKLAEIGGIPGIKKSVISYHKYVYVPLDRNLFKVITLGAVHSPGKDKEITIFEDGESHLKFFDSRGEEVYYRSSCGIQRVTINGEIISHLNYLDNCVICKDEIDQIFNNLILVD